MRVLYPLLSVSCIDIPNDRSSHKIEKPRGGGSAFVLSGVINSCIYMKLLPVTSSMMAFLYCAPLAIIGLADDFLDIPKKIRFVVQLISSTLITCQSTLVAELFINGGVNIYKCIGLLSIIICNVGIVNMTNFMYGIDGLVASCMAVTFTTIGITTGGNAEWIVVGSLISFLIWNWQPAKIFMGDVGSTYLGIMLCALTLNVSTWDRAISIVLVASALYMDALTCLMRRIYNKEAIFTAHRLHLYQRLIRAGWTHSKVTKLYLVGTVIQGVACVREMLWLQIVLLTIFVAIGSYLDRNVAMSYESCKTA